MRIVQVHNQYLDAGGEDAVVLAERQLLKEHGNDVEIFVAANSGINLFEWIRVGWHVGYSWRSRRLLTEFLRQFTPTIVHVHNFFPLLTPSIFDSCAELGLPVVMTLHNYRLISPNAMLMRRGGVDEYSVKGSAYRCALHACYRGSFLQTLAVAHMIETHRRRGTWKSRVARFVALTEFARRKFVEGGLPAEKIVVKPNFCEDHGVCWEDCAGEGRAQGRGGAGALFVGRLSSEKGIGTLLRAWMRLGVPLRVVGEGPLGASGRGGGTPGAMLLGRLPPAQVRGEMKRAAFLVMPSEWYESFPMVIVESFSCGLPVIASRLGAMAEIVEDGVTGLHFEAGNAEDLAAKVRWAVAHPDEMCRMGRNARRIYEERYTPELNYGQLMAIYEEAIKSHANEGMRI